MMFIKFNFILTVPSTVVESPPVSIDNQKHQEELNDVLNALARQVADFQGYLALSKRQRKLLRPEFLRQHQDFLDDIIKKMRVLKVPNASSISMSNPSYEVHSSTPYRSDYIRQPLLFSIGSQSTDTSEHFDDLHSTFTYLTIFQL